MAEGAPGGPGRGFHGDSGDEHGRPPRHSRDGEGGFKEGGGWRDRNAEGLSRPAAAQRGSLSLTVPSRGLP